MNIATGTLARREMMRIAGLAGLGAALLPHAARAASGDPAGMEKVAGVLDKWVGPGKFPGMVAALGLPGQDAQYIVRGTDSFSDLDKQGPDSLYRIFSMTKPVTGMAAMMLISDGKLGLDQPLDDILPAYAKMQVQVTPDGSITDVRPAKNRITIRHLLTHTSGLGYAIIQRGPLRQAYADAGLGAGRISRQPIPGIPDSTSVTSLAEFANKLATMPLVYEPGTKWSYSVGLDLMGRVIELVSGMSFEQFLKRRIFEPAGMTSTYFQVPAKDVHRLTTSFGAMGSTLVPIDTGDKSIYLDKPPAPFGGSGLVGSPRDYDRFLRMLANFGTLGGKRIISELAVRVGTGNLLPDGVPGPSMGMPAGQFGAGGRVGIGAEAGIFGWAGAAGTVGTVDMRSGLRASIWVQFMPPTSNSFLSEYQKALQADLALRAGAGG